MLEDKERDYLEKRRVALLAEVDAIEEYLEMPKTSDMRKWAKEQGYYQLTQTQENDKISQQTI